MAKKEMNRDTTTEKFKLITFWVCIFAITVCFAVLFIFRFGEMKTFDSYEDIQGVDYSVRVDIKNKKDAQYYVYIYSAKEDFTTKKLTDTSNSNVSKAQNLKPDVFNYFNYYRRNYRDKSLDLSPIYGYNVRGNKKDNVFNVSGVSATIDTLPVLVLLEQGSVSRTWIKSTDIINELKQYYQ